MCSDLYSLLAIVDIRFAKLSFWQDSCAFSCCVIIIRNSASPLLFLPAGNCFPFLLFQTVYANNVSKTAGEDLSETMFHTLSSILIKNVKGASSFFSCTHNSEPSVTGILSSSCLNERHCNLCQKGMFSMVFPSQQIIGCSRKFLGPQQQIFPRAEWLRQEGHLGRSIPGAELSFPRTNTVTG